MKTPFIERPHTCDPRGVQKVYKFTNGYGASVVRFRSSYGGSRGLWELAVLKFDADGEWDLTYETPITSDVIGHLTDDEVDELLDQIEALPHTSSQTL